MSIKTIERKDGRRYQVYGQRDGQKVYVGSFESKRAAMDADEDFRTTQRKIERGELPPALDTKRTFGTAARAWLAKLAGKSASHEDYSNRLDLYLLPRFEHVPLAEIRRADMVQWRDTLSESVSGATVNTVMGTASAAFTYFVELDWIPINPVRGVKRLKADARVFPWLETPEAITRLLSELPHKWRTLVAFLVGTGCRLDEALMLKWDDVDIEHRLVTLRKTKSGKARRVPIFDSVLSVLKEMKLQRGTEAYLWPGGRPGKRLSQPAVRRPFKQACTRAGLPPQLRLHDLRHTFASLFLVDGGDIFKLSRILGHSSVTITERTYAHLKKSAFEEDYGRVRFAMPTEAKVYRFDRDGSGRITDRVLVSR
jgi:integrase